MDTVHEKKFLQDWRRAFRFYQRRANILVCGYNGSGKSSLINAIFGDDVVPPDAIGNEGRSRTMGFDQYPKQPSSTELVRVFDSKGMELGETEKEFVGRIRPFISERQNDRNIDNHIHIVWYVINGAIARVTSCDLSLIKTIFNPDEVIVVIMKSDTMRPPQKESVKKVLLDAKVAEDHIVFACDKLSGSKGCRELAIKTCGMIPAAFKNAVAEKQRVDKKIQIATVEKKGSSAEEIIKKAKTKIKRSYKIRAATLLPAQISMISSLAGLYSISAEQIENQVFPFIEEEIEIFVNETLVTGFFRRLNISFFGKNLLEDHETTKIMENMGYYVKSQFEKLALAKIEEKYPHSRPHIEIAPQSLNLSHNGFVEFMKFRQ